MWIEALKRLGLTYVWDVSRRFYLMGKLNKMVQQQRPKFNKESFKQDFSTIPTRSLTFPIGVWAVSQTVLSRDGKTSESHMPKLQMRNFCINKHDTDLSVFRWHCVFGWVLRNMVLSSSRVKKPMKMTWKCRHPPRNTALYPWRPESSERML